MIKRFLAMVCIPVMLSTSPLHAGMTDSLIEGAKLCTRYLPRYEREYGIPTHLLSAISSTESGRFHKGLGISIPWPWTINAEGKGYYFDSKAEAIAAARKLRAQGVRSMDIGCMQVNLMHHPQAFASIEQAFEPERNIAYAASFLRNLYEESKSWKTAAASYHSKTPSRGKQYVGNVYDRWYSIVSRLREAKLQAPGVSQFAQSSEPAVATPAPAAQPKPVKIAALPEQRGTKTPAYVPPRMNSIKVTRQEDKRERGIIVVRPDIKVVDAPASVKVDSSSEVVTVARIQPASASKVIHVNNVSNGDSVMVKSGPRFIFDN